MARLLYESAAGRYDLFAGGRERALRLLAVTIATPGNDTSRDGVLVALFDSDVAGALAAFSAAEMEARRRRWMRLAYRRRAPWRWPRMMRVAAAAAGVAERPPSDALYVDGLATDPRFRRRGVASALLDAASERARSLGLRSIALDTAAGNVDAQALYRRERFTEVGRSDPRGPIPAAVLYVREVA